MTYNYANISVFVMSRTRVLEADDRNQLYHNSNIINYSICYHSYSVVIYSHSINIDGNVIEVIMCVGEGNKDFLYKSLKCCEI
jgi:hypothetical protein